MFTYIMLFLFSGSFLSKYTILRLQCFISPSAISNQLTFLSGVLYLIRFMFLIKHMPLLATYDNWKTAFFLFS